jgi:hypothetical protein
VRNPIVRIVIAIGVATTVFTAIVLGYAASTEARFNPGAALLLALAAVWIGQTLVALARRL